MSFTQRNPQKKEKILLGNAHGESLHPKKAKPHHNIKRCKKEDSTAQYNFDLDEKENLLAVVLGYYNGNAFLKEQLQSIFEQSHKEIEVFISDDCSTSKVDSKKIGLKREALNRLHLLSNSKNVGFCYNFLNALQRVNGPFSYFAFSDQDDIWFQEKIQTALKIIRGYPSEKPVLYCARTMTTDASCQVNLGKSPLFKKPPSFSNALVQSIAGGNTMVFNKAARDIIIKASSKANVVSHDWWCYQIISGAGGIVHYDKEPCLRYRQHSNNVIGSNNSLFSRFARLKGLLNGRYRSWNERNLTALNENRDLLTKENQKKLDDFISARKAKFLRRLLLSKRSGIYRQTLMGNLGLLFGLIINRV